MRRMCAVAARGQAAYLQIADDLRVQNPAASAVNCMSSDRHFLWRTPVTVLTDFLRYNSFSVDQQ